MHVQTRQSPTGALVRGVIAGAAGSLAMSVFFAVTKKLKLAPVPPRGAFDPPETEQREESETQVVARRFIEKLMQRGPIAHKELGGELVHYAFGAGWGTAYGATATSLRGLATLPGALAFGGVVWVVSDHVIVPGFRLAGWPQHYPPKNHIYALAAHLVYGAAMFAIFRLVSRRRPLQFLR